MSHRSLSSVAAAVAVTLAGCQGTQTRGPDNPPLVVAQAPPITVDTTRAPRLTIDLFCSPTRLRTGVAAIRWPAERLGGADSVQVDYTVFKDGFQTGQFGSLGTDAAPRAQILFRSDRQLTAMALVVFPDTALAGERGIRAERLDPGVTYYWRARGRFAGQWIAGASTRTSAPTCVADDPSPTTRQ